MVKPLAETDVYVLFKEYKSVFLFDKDRNTNLWRFSLLWEPGCGLIGLSNEWVLIGGADLLLWRENDIDLITIQGSDLKWIYDMRQTGDFEVEILTDPWSEDLAIWNYNIATQQKHKVKDFNEFKDKEYSDNVKW